MRFPDVKIAWGAVRYAFWPTRMDNGIWVWLEPYRVYTKDLPGPTYYHKETLDARCN